MYMCVYSNFYIYVDKRLFHKFDIFSFIELFWTDATSSNSDTC